METLSRILLIPETQARIPGFCQDASACGFGTCAETQDFCICDSGYTASNYLFNLPTCREHLHTRPLVLGLLCTVGLAIATFAHHVGEQTHGSLRTASRLACLSELWFSAGMLVLYVENYWGLYSVVFYWIHSLLNMHSAMMVVENLLEVFLVSTYGEEMRLQAKFFYHLIAIGVPTTYMLIWLIPLPFAAQGDWATFNAMQYIYLWSINLVVVVFILFPLMYSIREIGKILSKLEKTMEDPTKLIQLRNLLQTAQFNFLTYCILPSSAAFLYMNLYVDYAEINAQWLFFLGNHLSVQIFIVIPLQFSLQSAQVLKPKQPQSNGDTVSETSGGNNHHDKHVKGGRQAPAGVSDSTATAQTTLNQQAVSTIVNSEGPEEAVASYTDFSRG